MSKINQYTVYMIIGTIAIPIAAKAVDGWWRIIPLLVAIVAYALSLTAINAFVEKYSKEGKTWKGISSLYLDVAIFYSVVYMFAVVASPNGEFLSGVYKICDCKSYTDIPSSEIADGIVMTLLNSLYYSVVNMVTLGDSSISPKEWVRFIVASQVAFTFYITVFGLAQYFNKQGAMQLDQAKNEIIHHVKANKEHSDKSHSNNSIKKISWFKRPVIALRGIVTGYFV